MCNEKVVPVAAFEFISETPGGEWDKTPRTGKFWVYEQGICIPHYAILDPWQVKLEAFELFRGKYRPAKVNERGHFPIRFMGLEYGFWNGLWAKTTRPWLRFWDSQGKMLLTPEELSDQVKRQAEQAQRQAVQAEREKRKAFDKLRELGIDPEQLK
jgi:Putative restriction endonuclease